MNMRHVHTPGRRRLLSAGLTLAGLSLFGFGLPSTAVAQDCGQGWVQRTAEGPSTYEICYDEARGVTVAYWDQRTWEWDGEAWTMVAEVADGPGPRGAGAMVYDPYGERCLLFGGYSTGSAKRDLWSWDGSVWTQLSAGPNVSGRGDFNDDGRVAAADLGMLIGAWGRKGKLPYDLDGDGTVGQGDLASLLAAWGVCP